MPDRPIAFVGSQDAHVGAVEQGLRLTGMDIRGDRRGCYRTLELDPSPMFLGFETRAGVDITGPLGETLLSHASRG